MNRYHRACALSPSTSMRPVDLRAGSNVQKRSTAAVWGRPGERRLLAHPGTAACRERRPFTASKPPPTSHARSVGGKQHAMPCHHALAEALGADHRRGQHCRGPHTGRAIMALDLDTSKGFQPQNGGRNSTSKHGVHDAPQIISATMASTKLSMPITK